MKPKITVIVPIYNTAEYLPECLDSLIGQTYQNLEIILIDDGSTDPSGRIADEYAARDARIKVIHKENGGVTQARNMGVDIATGQYIGFVDSDDSVNERYFETLLHHLRQNQADICFGISRIMGKTYKDKEITFYQFTANEGIMHLLKADLFGCAVNKLYRAELWKGLRIPEDFAINEDLLTNFYLFGRAQKIFFFDEKLYNYRHREGSASRSGFNRKQLDIIRVNRIILDSLSDSELRTVSEWRYCNALSFCHNGTVTTPGFEAKRKEIEQLIRKAIVIFLKNPLLGWKKKATLFVQGYCSLIYRFMLRRLS